MVHIPITIQKEKIPLFERIHIGSILGTFFIGMLLGVFMTGNFISGLKMSVSRQLAGVGDALLPESNTPVSQIDTPADQLAASDPITDETLAADQPALPAIPLPSPDETRASLNAMISEKTVAADRLSQEMLRIKNESIALIAGFNQNCANWNDACAAPYKEALDKNNASYERLVSTLATWNQEIADANAALLTTLP